MIRERKNLVFYICGFQKIFFNWIFSSSLTVNFFFNFLKVRFLVNVFFTPLVIISLLFVHLERDSKGQGNQANYLLA